MRRPGGDVPYGKCLPRTSSSRGRTSVDPPVELPREVSAMRPLGVASDVAASFRICPSQTPKVAFGQLVIDGRRTTSLAKLADVRVGPLQKFMHLD